MTPTEKRSLPGWRIGTRARGQKESPAAMMGPAHLGGVTRPARAQNRLTFPRPSPAWASATTAPRYSRFVHQLTFRMFSTSPGQAGPPPPLSCTPRTPEHFRAGAGPGRGRCRCRRRRPPPQAPQSALLLPQPRRRR